MNNRLLSNAVMSVLQVLVTSCTLFFLYKILLATIGVRRLGVWSLVTATGSLAQLANMGLAGGVTKFVASYAAKEDHQAVSRVVQTAAIALCLSTGVVLAIVFVLAKPILSIVMPAESLPDALSILPYALVSIWIFVLTGVFQAALDGYQRIDSRNMIVIGGSLIYFVLCAVLAIRAGLLGVALAGVLQNVWLLAATLHILRKKMPYLPVLRYRFDRAKFKEMLSYGAQVQLISVAVMACDPVTKAFLSRFGSLTAVGYYEMANRMVQQIRLVIASPVFSLVPAVADLKEKDSNRITALYLSSYQLVFSLSMAAYALVTMSIPVISLLWIGRFESAFVAFTLLLSAGYWFNLLAVSAYFSNLGSGELSWNVISHVVTAVLNVLCGYLLGRQFGGVGVVAGWTLALIVGSAIITAGYHSTNHIDTSRLLPRSNLLLLGMTALGIVATYGLLPRYLGSISRTPELIAGYSVFPLLFLVVIWMHPARKQVFDLITVRMAKR